MQFYAAQTVRTIQNSEPIESDPIDLKRMVAPRRSTLDPSHYDINAKSRENLYLLTTAGLDYRGKIKLCFFEAQFTI